MELEFTNHDIKLKMAQLNKILLSFY